MASAGESCEARRASLTCGGAVALAVVVMVSGLGAAEPAPMGPLLASIFQDHAVLQRDRPIAVWGRAAAGETVSVSLNGQQATARVDDSGRWSARLPARGAGGPFTLEARAASGAAQTLSDVLVGDVWLCHLVYSRFLPGLWRTQAQAAPAPKP
jgi:sialate O-acetylesterase